MDVGVVVVVVVVVAEVVVEIDVATIKTNDNIKIFQKLVKLLFTVGQKKN